MSLGELTDQITSTFEDAVQNVLEMTPNGLIMRVPPQEHTAFEIDGLEPSPMNCLTCDFPPSLCKCPPPPPDAEDPLFAKAPEVLHQFADVMAGLSPTAGTQPNTPTMSMPTGSPSGVSGGPSSGAPGGPG